MANPDDYVVLIPSDGSVISGYTTIINNTPRTRTPPS
jgi:putative spermidine/putrescine transport system substrate-binding protein